MALFGKPHRGCSAGECWCQYVGNQEMEQIVKGEDRVVTHLIKRNIDNPAPKDILDWIGIIYDDVEEQTYPFDLDYFREEVINYLHDIKTLKQ